MRAYHNLTRVLIFFAVLVLGLTAMAQTTVPSRLRSGLGTALKFPLELLSRDRMRRLALPPPSSKTPDIQTQETLELRRELDRLITENARLSELQRENAALREELQFFETERFPVVVARIIGRFEELDTEFFIINRGQRDGVAVGQPVTIAGTLLGKIVQARDSVSIFTPLTSRGVKTTVTLPGLEKTIGILEGELNTNLVVRLIPKDVTISPGTAIITSDLTEHIPRGLIVGIVSTVDANPQDLFQTAYVRPSTSTEASSLVSVIKHPQKHE